MRNRFTLALFGGSMIYTKAAMPALFSSLFFMSVASADDHLGHQHHHGGPRALAHAPIGVMGDHVHKEGDWMFSYRFMTMNMDGNQSGSSNISPEEIVTTVTNPFSGPPTLRVVPTKMTMDMHMLGAMYAPSDKFTLMVMANYIEKDMDHITFQGMMGSNRLGTFKTKSKGFGDTKVSGLINIYSNNKHKVHLNLGISLPTGSITKKDNVLTPIGTRPEIRLPYAMQLGSGTFDLLPGITWQMYEGNWNVGAQYMATIRTGENDEDYTLGDEHNITSWASYAWRRGLSTSIRLAYQDVDNIDGQDSRITAPVQTANPDNYGRERLDLLAGLNWVSQSGHRLAFEVGTPIYQHLDGPQMETDWILTAGYQYAF